MKELDAIKQALAAGPTPGEWKQQEHARFSVVGEIPVAACGGYSSNSRDPESLHDEMLANANYIAACNPTAMQKIIAHIEAQAAEIAAYDLAIAEYRQQCIDNHAEIERLRAESDERLKNTVAQAMEIERLRPDAERYRHIRSKKSRDHNHHSKRALEAGICDWSRSLDQNSTCSFWSTADLTEEALDEAVDASIKEKP